MNQEERTTHSDFDNWLLGVVIPEEEIQEEEDMEVVGTQMVLYRYCFEVYHLNEGISLKIQISFSLN